jgi:Leucine-rich repeat (LRR) protein
MKILLTGLSICIATLISFNISGQAITFNDPSFKNALLDHQPKIDLNNNGEIEIDEASKVAKLWVHSINNLNGIGYFQELTHLDCSYSSLTSIDVSKNRNLKSLNCSRNKISSLDLSNNINVESVSASENILVTLDLSKNTNLIELAADFNKLTAVLLPHSNTVRSIKVSDNQIS